MSDWAGAGGSVIGGILGMIGQGQANAANASMAREAANFNLFTMMENQRFQERMSSTAYQRAMNDMRYAGLNPILAYSQGGATTPGGMGASMQAATMENTMDDLGKGVSSAAQAAKDAELSQVAKAQVGNVNAQTGLTKAQESVAAETIAKVKQETATSAADANRKNAETAVLAESVANPAAQRALWGAQASSASAQAALDKQRLENNARYGDSPVGRIGQSGENFIKRIGGALVEKIKGLMDAQAGHSAKSAGGGPSDGPPPSQLEIDIRKDR